MTIKTRPNVGDFAGKIRFDGKIIAGDCIGHDPDSTCFRVCQMDGSKEEICASSDEFAVVWATEMSTIRNQLFEVVRLEYPGVQAAFRIMTSLSDNESFPWPALKSEEPLVEMAEEVALQVLGDVDFDLKWHIVSKLLFG